ncbi:hypothetical protein LPJ66_002993 [Kickxella alabastrina]|uniref:Uncharacterized protein n=1 Tax=Kickxella alabastrina TaxID=61397 RepID=A0ACC1ILT7_9FUNG|nr:hypothetical protein LPJ66_002993 [Kickxella alabastrina]
MSSQVTRIVTPRSRAANTLAKLEDALSNPPCLSCSHLEMKYKAVDSMLGRKIIEVMEKGLEIRRITAEAQKRKVALDVRYNDYVNATRTSLESVNTDFSIAQDRIHELEQINGEHMALIDDAKMRVSECQQVYNNLDAARREMDELRTCTEQAEATANNANAEKEALRKQLDSTRSEVRDLRGQLVEATTAIKDSIANGKELNELLNRTRNINNDLNGWLTAANTTTRIKRKEYQKKLKDAHDENQSLVKQLAMATADINNASTEKEALCKRLATATAAANDAHTKEMALCKELDSTCSEVQSLRGQLSESTGMKQQQNVEKEALREQLNDVHYWNHDLREQLATATITANFASSEKETLHELLAAVTSAIPNGTDAEKEALCKLLAAATTSISNGASTEKEALREKLNSAHYSINYLREQLAAATTTANGAIAEKKTFRKLLRMNIAAVSSAGAKEGTLHNSHREELGVSTDEPGNAHRATGKLVNAHCTADQLDTVVTTANGADTEMRALRTQLHGAISTASAAFDERDDLQKKLATSWAEKNWFVEQLKAATACSDHLRKLLYEATHTNAVEPNSAYLCHELAKSDKKIDQQQRTISSFNKRDKANALAFESVHCILNIADRHIDQMVDAHSGWARGHTEILERLGKDLLEACELWLDNKFDLGLEEFKENMSKLAELMAARSECVAKKMTKANAAMRGNLGKLRNQLITGINVTNTRLGPPSVRSWHTNTNANTRASTNISANTRARANPNANANASRPDRKGKGKEVWFDIYENNKI